MCSTGSYLIRSSNWLVYWLKMISYLPTGTNLTVVSYAEDWHAPCALCVISSSVSWEAMASRLPLLLLVLCSLSLAQCQLRLYNLRATGLPADIFGVSDAYVKVFCGPATLGITATRHDEINPWWDEEFAYFSAQENDILRMEVMDHDLVFDDTLGVCQRQLKPGTHDHQCYLEDGGVFYYTYTLS